MFIAGLLRPRQHNLTFTLKIDLMTTRLPPRSQREILKIGELAEDLSTTSRTIRLYEELGLISPERTEGGTRLYRTKDAKRLAMALRLARLGLELRDVQRLAHTRAQCASGAEAVTKLVPLLDELQVWLESTLTELKRLQCDLQQTETLVRQCSACPNRPNRRDCPECPMEQNLDLTE
ncbi:MerR family transcriptional regulator, partial [Methylomagnum sp.]